MPATTAWARFAGRIATGAVECIDLAREPERLRTGTWFVVADFESDLGGGATGRPGQARAWRFTDVRDTPTAVGPPTRHNQPMPDTAWAGPRADTWTSTMNQDHYEAAVRRVREHIRDGDVYQANICRVLAAPLPRGPRGEEPDAAALTDILAAGNPAQYAAAIHVPATSGIDPVWVVSASPELYLSLDGDAVTSGPIKGTARTPAGLQDKDRAENVMITDLVRNDLHQVSMPGTIEVTDLLAVEPHPGLVHLVSRVRGTLDHPHDPALWGRLLAGTFPPGSVSGAPKSSALRIIRELEPTTRGPYCGAIGWIDGDARRAQLAVGIRTFWWHDDTLRFGTGAGITWGSDPTAEWHETELKAARLVALASTPPADPSD